MRRWTRTFCRLCTLASHRSSAEVRKGPRGGDDTAGEGKAGLAVQTGQNAGQAPDVHAPGTSGAAISGEQSSGTGW